MRLPRSSPTFVSKLEGPRQWFSRSFAAVSNPKEENKTEFSRSFASASKPKEEKKIELPIQVYGVFGNYASALFLSAAKAGVLDQVESEFLEFAEAAKNSPSFSRFVKNLAVPQKTTVKAMTDICAHIELSHIVKNCLLLMAENGRLRYLEDVAKCFVQLTRARRGEVDAIVTSASPLPPDQVKEVTAAVQEILGGGKKIFLKQKVDPGLIGGLVLEFDNRSIDLSIQTRLNKMKEIMLKDF
nr:delta subunit of Mt ATP synthase [Viscum album]